MDKTVISKQISRIMTDITKLSNTLCAMDKTNVETHSDNYTMLTTDASLRSELIACRMRHLLYDSTDVKKETYLTSAGVVQGIKIKNSDGVFEVTLPRLLPKRKKRQSTEFITDPLYFTISQYADSHTMPKFKHCVVCFSHIYDERLSIRRVRDYDNLEQKQILDVIATYIMEDDSGILVDAYNTTEVGETDCTRISVMQKDRFARWLTERENTLKSISDF